MKYPTDTYFYSAYYYVYYCEEIDELIVSSYRGLTFIFRGDLGIRCANPNQTLSVIALGEL